MRNRLLLLALIASAAACDDTRDPVSVTPQPPMPLNGSVAYLAVSDPQASAGATVTVTAVVRHADAAATVGSFSAKLSYDAAGLTFVNEAPIGSGMRAINPREGAIVAAGASADGFDGGRLFAVNFRVDDPAALASLSLAITELSGQSFRDDLPSLRVHASLVAGR